MFCINCGTELPNDARFCRNCGKPQMICPSCGKQMETGDKFCTNCGYDFITGRLDSRSAIPTMGAEIKNTSVPPTSAYSGVDTIGSRYAIIVSKAQGIKSEAPITIDSIRSYEKELRIGYPSEYTVSIQSTFSSLYDTYNYKKFDISSGKTTFLIQSLLSSYNRIHDKKLLVVALFVYEKQTNIKMNIYSELDAGIENLFKYSNGIVCTDFILSNGSLPNVISAWSYYQNAPQILVHTMLKDFFRSRKNNVRISSGISSLAKASFPETSFKNIILFSVLKKLNPTQCSRFEVEPPDSAVVCDALLNAILTELKTFETVVIIVSSGERNVAIDESDFTIYDFVIESSNIAVECGDAAVLLVPIIGKPSILRIEKKANDIKSRMINLYDLVSKLISKSEKAKVAKRTFEIYVKDLPQSDTRVLAKTNEAQQPVSGSSSPAISIDSKLHKTINERLTYADLTQRMHSVKTQTDVELIIRTLHEFAKSNDSHKISAIKDLIQFYSRKDVAEIVEDSSEKAIQVYNSYHGLFESDNIEKSKLAKLIIPSYIKQQDYRDAVKCLEIITDVRTNTVFAGQLAFCYLQLGDYSNALTAISTILRRNTVTTAYAWAIKYAILANVGLKDLTQAERLLSQLKREFPNDLKYNDLSNFIETARTNDSDEQTIYGIKSILPVALNNGINNSIISELIKPYFMLLLEKCQFEHLRDRSLDEISGKWTWQPTNNNQASGIVTGEAGLKSREANVIRTSGVLDSELQKAYEANLTISKMSQLCARVFSDYDIMWTREFYLGAARALWCKARLMSIEDQNNGRYISDSTMYHYRECVRLLTLYDTDDFANRFEFYDSIVHIASGLVSAKHEILPFKSKLPTEQAKKKLSEVLNSAILSDAKSAIKILGRLLEQCPDITEFMIGYLANINSRDKLLSTYMDVMGITEPIGIDEVIQVYLDALYNEKHSVERVLSSLRNELFENDINSSNIRNLITNSVVHNYYLSDYEFNVYNSLATIIHMFCDTLISNNYAEQMNNCSNIDLGVQRLKSDLDKTPTDILFDYIPDILERLSVLVREFSNNLYLRHKPFLEVFDDYGIEGYTPQNRIIFVQLRIRNGRDCFQARAISLTFEETDETKKYYSLRQLVYNCPFWLDGDMEQVYGIEIDTTLLGQEHNQLYNIFLRANCRSIRDEEIKGDPIVLTISIKGEGAFKRIDNPYNTRPLDPISNNVFYGREQEIEQISNNIANQEPNGMTVVIYGQYRSGKTSFANYVCARIKSLDETIVWSKLVLNTNDTFELIISRIINSIIKELKNGSKNIDNLCRYDIPVLQISTDPKIYLLEFLDELKDCSKNNNYHIVLQIDEFGRLYNSSKIDSQYFMEVWKEIMEVSAFDAILIGHDVLTELLVKNDNAFGTSYLLHLNYLDSGDATKLIQTPTYSEDIGNRFMKDAVDEIQRMTGGAAFYIQSICLQAINFMNENQINRINANYLNICVSSWLSNMTTGAIGQLFHPMYRSGEMDDSAVDDEDAKSVLCAIAFLNKTPERATSITAIVNWLSNKESEKGWDQQRIEAAINSLTNRWVIYYDGAYYIRVRLYEDFLTGSYLSKGSI